MCALMFNVGFLISMIHKSFWAMAEVANYFSLLDKDSVMTFSTEHLGK